MTDEEMARSHKQLGVLEAGAEVGRRLGRLWPSARARHRQRGAGGRGRVVTTDGPFVESKEHLGGFYILRVEDLDAALAWAWRVTDAVKVPIEVRPFAGFEA
jgi:hypothetical protein